MDSWESGKSGVTGLFMSTVRSLSTKCSRMHTCATLLQTFYGADGYSIHVSGSWFYMHF